MLLKFAVYYASMVFLWSVARLYPDKAKTGPANRISAGPPSDGETKDWP
jgi:hypothetical protein